MTTTTKPGEADLTAKSAHTTWTHVWTALCDVPCECSFKRREEGDHLSGCYLFDLNIALQEAAALGTAPATHVPASEALSLVIEAWDRYCDGGRTENDAETFVIMFNAARRDATPVPAKWIDDPHDIEQGQMLNPEWLAFHGVTAQQIPKP